MLSRLLTLLANGAVFVKIAPPADVGGSRYPTAARHVPAVGEASQGLDAPDLICGRDEHKRAEDNKNGGAFGVLYFATGFPRGLLGTGCRKV